MVLTPEKAQAARDGFAQLVYSCLFSWLIARVNESLQPAQAAQVSPYAHACASAQGRLYRNAVGDLASHLLC